MKENGIALRHVGNESRFAGDFSAGNSGDAIPLAGAADILKHERAGGHAGVSSFVPAFKNDISNHLDDFNARLREKLVQIIDSAIRGNSSDPVGGTASYFILLRDKHGANSPYEYDPQGTYPLGKSGKSDLSADQILTVIRLTDQDREQMQQTGRSAAECLADKVLSTIPKVRDLTETMDTARKQKNALTILSTQAQIIIDGHLPAEALRDEVDRFSRNMRTLVHEDPQNAANFCCSVLSHPKLGALADAAQESYRHSIMELAGRDPQTAVKIALIHKEVYGDKVPSLTDDKGPSPSSPASGTKNSRTAAPA